MFLNLIHISNNFCRGVSLLALIFISCSVQAVSLEEILSRKKIIVGLYLDPSELSPDGSPAPVAPTVKMEIALAEDLAKDLGVTLQTVNLNLADREPALQEGSVDLLIASMSDTESRRNRMLHVLPSYYESGVNIITRRNNKKIRSWENLHNRRICSQRGAFYNRIMSNEFGIDVIALHHNSLAIEALLDGRCIAIVYDETTIRSMLKEKEWREEYHMPLQTLHKTPWSIFIQKELKGSALEAYLSDTVIRWHRTGLIIKLEKQFDLYPSPFAERMNVLWNKKVNGRYYCGEKINVSTLRDCLGQVQN